jgi:hypothetical protein
MAMKRLAEVRWRKNLWDGVGQELRDQMLSESFMWMLKSHLIQGGQKYEGRVDSE